MVQLQKRLRPFLVIIHHPLITYTKEKLKTTRLTDKQVLSSSILLKTEVRYMVTVNILTADGLVKSISKLYCSIAEQI